MQYELYKGYILGPGSQIMPAYGVYETGVFKDKAAVGTYMPIHIADSTEEAKTWLDRHFSYNEVMYGEATQADVDELNGVGAGKKYQLSPFGVLLRDISDAIERQAVLTGYGPLEASVSVDQIMMQTGQKGFQKSDVEQVLQLALNAGFVYEV